ncbi:hypothetical protein C943_00225 [Mariniradius saccharolyticus AK6]|uniref:Uncharacterized protein n=1 Tax=Mariniradius saccharolyticus AK6 TaxID=1239962 RepID=M7Y400_9BACT|nr:hypothetical protein C943_00225 [Mariniradius saccharolyticus AK6]
MPNCLFLFVKRIDQALVFLGFENPSRTLMRNRNFGIDDFEIQ